MQEVIKFAFTYFFFSHFQENHVLCISHNTDFNDRERFPRGE